jgi:hypothetical protein
MKKIAGLLFVSCICICSAAQKFYFPKAALSDSGELTKAMPVLANKVIINYKENNYRDSLSNLSRLQVLAGRYSEADVTLDSLRYASKETDPQFWSLVDAQVNYGTGKDVSDETIEDAQIPLQIKWYNDSIIKIPVWK